MSWQQVSDLIDDLKATHAPSQHHVDLARCMLMDAQAKDPDALGAAFLAQSITELLTPMAA